MTLSTNANERIFSHFLADMDKGCQNLEKKKQTAYPMSGGFEEMAHGICSFVFFRFLEFLSLAMT